MVFCDICSLIVSVNTIYLSNVGGLMSSGRKDLEFKLVDSS